MTAWLTELFTSGWISVVAVLVLWLVILMAARRAPHPMTTVKGLVPNGLSGSALLAAFGLAMRQGPVPWLALLLTVSLITFVVDIRIRLASQASGFRRRTE
jgi:hypothetical protein